MQTLSNVQVASVKAVLHTPAAQGELPACREQECAELRAFLEGSLAQQRSGAVYISGVPGTGEQGLLEPGLQCN